MTPEEIFVPENALDTVARILFQNTPAEQLQDFESIEHALLRCLPDARRKPGRHLGHLLEEVGPRLGNFFGQRQSNPERAYRSESQLCRDVNLDGESRKTFGSQTPVSSSQLSSLSTARNLYWFGSGGIDD